MSWCANSSSRRSSASARASRWDDARSFGTISQTQIHYGDSALSEGKAGRVKGGDRLPWTGQHGPDNFEPLASLDWQAHVYGEAERQLVETCQRLRLPLRAYPWSEGAQRAGLRSDAAYLVRPDGYVALAASGKAAADQLTAFADKHRVRFG